MEKKLIDRIFEALRILIFPIENTEGKKNPATLFFLTFVKEVLEEIKTKILLDYFLHNWEGLQEKFSIEFDNSFFSSKIILIYGNINYILNEKEKTINEYHHHDKSDFPLLNKINKKIPILIEESKNLQVQAGWIKEDFKKLKN